MPLCSMKCERRTPAWGAKYIRVVALPGAATWTGLEKNKQDKDEKKTRQERQDMEIETRKTSKRNKQPLHT